MKPLDFIVRDTRGRLIQPALKVRGREYLRIIYGPEYGSASSVANPSAGCINVLWRARPRKRTG